MWSNFLIGHLYLSGSRQGSLMKADHIHQEMIQWGYNLAFKLVWTCTILGSVHTGSQVPLMSTSPNMATNVQLLSLKKPLNYD